MTLRVRSPRLSVRAVLVEAERLLLVNAWPGRKSDLWCAPGGGVEPGHSLPDNLRREVHEETGLEIDVGDLCLVNEFHDPASGFHQVELFFRCTRQRGETSTAWQDPEGIVNRWIWAGRHDAGRLRVKPNALFRVAFEGGATAYDPLEVIQR